jgi:CPA2 family monovalent cation:H+ antiporter-2
VSEVFVQDLASVLVVAGIITVLARALGQSPIVGYLAAGFIVGPYIPLPVFADPERVRSLASFGVVLVMFAVGIEFSFSRLATVLPRAGLAAVFQMWTLGLLGHAIGGLLGFGAMERMFLACGLAISSTMIVSRIYESRSISRDVRELVFGVLIVQDVAAIVLLAALTAYAATGAMSVSEVGMVLLELAGALVLLALAGMLFVPRLIRTSLSRFGPESVVVIGSAIAFGFAALAEAFGYSTALGAFLAGVLVGESGVGEEVEHIIRPLRDFFAAIFFVSVGMEVDPLLAIEHAPAVLLLALAVILGQLGSVSIAGILAGNSLRTSMIAGLSLGQVGEFGFLIAAIGRDAGARPELHALLVTTSLVTAFTTPLLLEWSEPIVRAVSARVPERFHRIVADHGAWLARSPVTGALSRGGRIAWRIAIDGMLILGIALASAIWGPTLVATLYGFGVPFWLARLIPLVLALLVMSLLGAAAVRATRALGRALEDEPPPSRD